MSTHKPPRRWGPALQDASRVQRTGGERFTRSAAPVPAALEAVRRAQASAVGVTEKSWMEETPFTIAAAGAQTRDLTYLPVDMSEDVELNGIAQTRGVAWQRTGQTLSLLPAMDARVGDTLTVQYQYLTGAPATVTGAWAAAVAAIGPLAWYRLGDVSNGGVMLDSSGHNHHGVYGAVTTHTLTGSLVPSEADGALLMTGAGGEGGSVPTGTWMNLTSNVSWVIFFKGTDTAARLWAREATSGGVQDWSLQAGSQLYFAAGGGVVLTSTASGLNDNNMHMAVYTYDGSNVKLYIDGSLDKTVAYSTALGTTAQDVFIGYGGGLTSSAMFTGTLDEAVWFSIALTSTQVTTLWNAANG